MSKTKIYDVLIIGELAGVDLMFAEHLSRKGLKCCVLRRQTKTSTEKISSLSSYHTHFREPDIIYYENGREFLKYANKSRLIVSFTGALIGALRMLWPLRHFLRLPPVVNITTGSDIMELAVEKSLLGVMYRQYLKFADLNWCAPYPVALKNLTSLKVPNVVFMHYPYYLLPDNHNIISTESTHRNKEKPLRFFHASHLDWKINDPGTHRKSAKGNDMFIKTFARAIKEGLDAYCVILDRGPDKDVAKELIRNICVEDQFIWKPHLTRDELVNEIRNADVVVDQFDCGGFGGIAIEAMSMGKPVMIYLQENCLNLLYAEPPPVLNCHTEEEIYEQIMKCRDRIYLQNISKKTKEWIYKYHHWETCLDQFLFYYTLLTGHRVLDYGWDWNPYADKEKNEESV